jgi:hypothetical protein
MSATEDVVAVGARAGTDDTHISRALLMVASVVVLGAMQSVSGAAAARASTALNIIQQTGASVGTAVLSVLLATELADQLGHGSPTPLCGPACCSGLRSSVR